MTISLKFRLLAIGLVVSTSLLVGGVMYWEFASLSREESERFLAQHLEIQGRRLERALGEIQRDLRVMASVPQVPALLQADSTSAELLDGLASVFTEVVTGNPHYVQARIIDVPHGQERLRVDRVGATVARTPEDQLQDKCDRDYFQQFAALGLGVVGFSRIDLNREHGEIEVPYRPMLRAGIRVANPGGEQSLLVVVNVDFQTFIDDLFLTITESQEFILTNAAGDYLVHPDVERTFGFERGDRQLAQRDYPELGVLYDGATASVTIDDAVNERLLQFRRFSPFPGDAQRTMGIGLATSTRPLERAAIIVGRQVLGITLGLVLLGIVFAFVFTRRLTAPLERITAAAESLARDEEVESLPTDRRDEVGTLARSFEHMSAQVTDRQARLDSTLRDLEHFIHLASHDLREPARRLGALASVLAASEEAPDAEILDGIEAASSRLLEQISDLRAFAGIGKGPLIRSSVDLGAITRSVIEEFAPEIELRDISTETDPLPTAFGYGTLLRVVYRNLLANALQCTDGQGISLHFTARKSHHAWVLGLRNTGSSIPTERLAGILQPFTRFRQGAGMGLSICRRIVDRHGGAIWIESDDDWVHVQFRIESGEPVAEDPRVGTDPDGR